MERERERDRLNYVINEWIILCTISALIGSVFLKYARCKFKFLITTMFVIIFNNIRKALKCMCRHVYDTCPYKIAVSSYSCDSLIAER
jgi:predicted branched-subunit amino acid permease